MPQMALVGGVGDMMNDVPEEICLGGYGCWVFGVGGGVLVM